jgi:hypothetical protein
VDVGYVEDIVLPPRARVVIFRAVRVDVDQILFVPGRVGHYEPSVVLKK